MARPNQIARPVRLLCLAIVGLQVGAAAVAIADTGAADAAAPSVAVEGITGPAARSSAALPAAPQAVPSTTVAPPVPPPSRAAVPASTPPARRPPSPTSLQLAPPDPAARVQAAYEASVPAAWRGAIAVRFQLIGGGTSWASDDGTIQIGSTHANGSESHLRATIAHEFGHLIAFRYGSQTFLGAAPEGWPPYSASPEEAWADCVSAAFTGLSDPSHALPPCGGSSLSWTADWVGAGPDTHSRTDA